MTPLDIIINREGMQDALDSCVDTPNSIFPSSKEVGLTRTNSRWGLPEANLVVKPRGCQDDTHEEVRVSFRKDESWKLPRRKGVWIFANVSARIELQQLMTIS